MFFIWNARDNMVFTIYKRDKWIVKIMEIVGNMINADYVII